MARALVAERTATEAAATATKARIFVDMMGTPLGTSFYGAAVSFLPSFAKPRP
jgi:hypothetical protein